MFYLFFIDNDENNIHREAQVEYDSEIIFDGYLPVAVEDGNRNTPNLILCSVPSCSGTFKNFF